jgi:hypothetical protein
LNTSAHLYILYRSCTIYSEPCRTSLGYHKISTSSAVGCVTPEVRSRILAQASDGSSEFIHHCPETHGQRHTQAEFNVAPDNNYPLRFATGRHVWRFTCASIHCFVSSSLSLSPSKPSASYFCSIPNLSHNYTVKMASFMRWFVLSIGSSPFDN